MKKTSFLSFCVCLWLIVSLLLLSACTTTSGTGSTTSDSTSSSTSSGTGTMRPPASSTTSSSTPDASACAHTDGNRDDYCDTCQIYLVVYFDFYAVNDLHGKFCDTDTQPGVDEMTAYLNQAYAQKDNVIIFSSGDMWQGSSESNQTKGQIITDWMNELDFVAMTLGNHEFDWGESFVEDNAELAEFPFLAINIYDKQTNKRVDYCQPSVMVERGGYQIGLIGAIGDCYSSISAEFVEDLYFLTGSDLTNLVKAEAEKLRAQGADLIVYSIHDGYGSSSSYEQDVSNISSYYDVALSNGYVDLVFEGHTHQNYVLKDKYGVYHIQGGGDNTYGISHAKVGLHILSQTVSVTQREVLRHSTYLQMQDDPIIAELLERYKELLGDIFEVIGTNSATRKSSELRQLVARLYYEAGIKEWGSEVQIVLAGGYIGVRSPYELPKGNVTYAQLETIFPFDNEILLCTIPGKTLKSQFFESTNSNYFIYYETYGASIKQNINDSATYYIVVDSYCAQYAPNRCTVVASLGTGIYAKDLLAEYAKAGGFGGKVSASLVFLAPCWDEAEKRYYL
ncbi:MAG: bifunctional metallophosphatase/5'-nucleotidase [Clostridia bacterium]|nr:bifunctional metallophosphatase/5'-nucleotidase [Clostridia bacterium]